MAAVSLLFVQTVRGFFTQLLTGLQVRENHCSGFKASPQGALQDSGALEPTRGEAGASSPGTCPRQLLLESLLGVALTLLQTPGLLDAHFSVSLFPAFGWTLHLTQPCGKSPQPPVSVSGERWVEKEASALG